MRIKSNNIYSKYSKIYVIALDKMEMKMEIIHLMVILMNFDLPKTKLYILLILHLKLPTMKLV